MNNLPDKKDDDEAVCRISILSTDSSELEIEVLENQDDFDKESHLVEPARRMNYNLLTPIAPNPDGVASYLKYENPWPNRHLSRQHGSTIMEESDDIFNTEEKLSLIKAYKENEVEGAELFNMVLSRPMEREVFEEAKEEITYIKNKEKCVNALKHALKQDFYSNFHFIALLNKNSPKVIEKCIFDQLGIKNFDEYDPKVLESFDSTKYEDFKVRLNVLKYILFFEKVGLERQKDLVKKLTSLEKVFAQKQLNDVKLKYWKALEAIWNKDLNSFTDCFYQYKKSIEEYYDDASKSVKKFYSPQEFESLITADCNLLILKDFSTDTKKIFRAIIKSKAVDIDRLVHIKRGEKTETPLVFYVAEKGYHDLLKAIFDSKKDVKTAFKDDSGKITSLYSKCVEGFSNQQDISKITDLHVDYDKTLDLILKNITLKDEKSKANKREKTKTSNTIAKLLETFTFSVGEMQNELFKEQNPMRKAMAHNYDNGALKLIQNFHLSRQFLEELNPRVLEKFLNSCVSVDQDAILVDYQFLRSYQHSFDGNRNAMEVIDYIMYDPDMAPLITHPVLKNYIESKCNRYSWWHFFDLLTFFLFYVVCFMLGFLMSDEIMRKVFLVVASSYIFVHSSYQLYFTEMTRTSEGSCTPGFHYVIIIVYVIALPFLTNMEDQIWALLLLTLPALYVIVYLYQTVFNTEKCSSQLRFRRKLSYLIEFTLFILTYTSIYYELYNWKFCFSVILILVIMYMTIQASLFPSCLANCIFMFEIAMKVVVKILFVFSWIFVLYAVGFETVFHDQGNSTSTRAGPSLNWTRKVDFNNFENYWTSFVKVVTMMTGDYETAFMNFSEWWSFGFFLFFLVIALALYNLINALTIIYVKESQDSSGPRSLERNWEIIKEYELFLEDGWGGLTTAVTQFLPCESYVIHYVHFYSDDSQNTPNIPEGKNVINIKVDPTKLDQLRQIARARNNQNQTDQEIKIENMEKTILQIHSTTSQIKTELELLTDRVGIHKEELSYDFSKQLSDQTESKSLLQVGLGGLNKENEARKEQLDLIMANLEKLNSQMSLYQKLETKLETLRMENEARKEQLNLTLEQLGKIGSNLKDLSEKSKPERLHSA